jgi:hypothetical protein
MSEILIWGWGVYIAAFFEGRGFVGGGSEGESLVLVNVVIVVEGIVFFEGRGFVRDRSEGKSLILIIIMIMIEEIIFAVFNSENMRDLIISIIIDLTNSIISFLIISGRYEN